jgi:Na+-transporting NADH:ubiquinone oxidoreductase subunit B
MGKRLFMKQPNMRKVIYSLLPILVFSVGNFGLRVLFVVALSVSFAFIIEYLFEVRRGKPVSEAVLVTGLLFGLILPPAVPIWIVAVGIVFAIVFGKMAFGGFGRNIFNPAMVGRAFVYISFPVALTVQWTQATRFWGEGFTSWLVFPQPVSGATPIEMIRYGEAVSRTDMFFGTIAGSAGETAKWLIIACAVYLVITKTASFKIIASTISAAFVLSSLLYLFRLSAIDPFVTLTGGSLLFGAVFMATDPVSAPRRERAKVYYGILIGSLTVIIGTFSLFGAGLMFAVLIANTFAPLIDHLDKWKVKK